MSPMFSFGQLKGRCTGCKVESDNFEEVLARPVSAGGPYLALLLTQRRRATAFT